jgi:outer membrane lipoprotein SlyB
MRNKALTLNSLFSVTDNRAKGCQNSGRQFCSSRDMGIEEFIVNRGRETMRKLWIIVCFLGMPWITPGQTNQAAWENLSALQAGQKIDVAVNHSKKITGTFVSISDSAITVQEGSGPQAVQRQDVRSVKLAKREHLVRNSLVGAALGAGVGAAIGAATDSPCKPGQSFCINPVNRGEAAGLFAVVGGVAGAIVGAVIPNHKTIYRAK